MKRYQICFAEDLVTIQNLRLKVLVNFPLKFCDKGCHCLLLPALEFVLCHQWLHLTEHVYARGDVQKSLFLE